MSYLDWKVGDKVVFQGVGSVTLVHTGWRKYVPGLNETRLSHHLEVGEIYEIEAITTHTDLVTFEAIVCIFIKGFRFREHKGVGFPACWFRKVQPRKTDISIFTSMLDGTKTKVPA